MISQQIPGVLPASPVDDDQLLPDSLPLVCVLLVGQMWMMMMMTMMWMMVMVMMHSKLHNTCYVSSMTLHVFLFSRYVIFDFAYFLGIFMYTYFLGMLLANGTWRVEWSTAG